MNLKDIRLARGMTQAQLAERVGMSQSNISRHESEQVQMTIKQAKIFARELECELDELIGGTDDDHEDTAGARS